MAFWRLLKALSYRRNPINQNSKPSSVIISIYFCAGFSTFSLRSALLIFCIGIKTCIKFDKHYKYRIRIEILFKGYEQRTHIFYMTWILCKLYSWSNIILMNGMHAKFFWLSKKNKKIKCMSNFTLIISYNHFIWEKRFLSIENLLFTN